MSDLGWFGVFGVILLLMALVSGWMVWFSRRAMRSHKGQIEDMVQDVFEFLLANHGRRLLAWNPELGSAKTFFGIIAERCVLNILDSRRRSPWTEDPVDQNKLELGAGTGDDLEQALGTREILRELGQRLLDDLNERDRQLFELLYIQQKEDEEVRDQLGLGRDALYQARRRLLQRVRKLAAEIVPECELLAGVGL